jgi:hypothetical protein
MFDPKEIQELSEKYEAVVRRLFEKNGAIVERLDNKKDSKQTEFRRRPDYFVRDVKSAKGFVCEVKSIFSADCVNGKHVSSIGSDFRKDGRGVLFDPKPNVEKSLENALDQFNILVKDFPKHKSAPFVIVAFPDFYVDEIHYVRVIDKYPIITAILFVERDKDLRKFLKTLSLEQCVAALNKESLSSFGKVPPMKKTWKLLRNRTAKHSLPTRFYLKILGDFAILD